MACAQFPADRKGANKLRCCKAGCARIGRGGLPGRGRQRARGTPRLCVSARYIPAGVVYRTSISSRVFLYFIYVCMNEEKNGINRRGREKNKQIQKKKKKKVAKLWIDFSVDFYFSIRDSFCFGLRRRIRRIFAFKTKSRVSATAVVSCGPRRLLVNNDG